MMANIEQLKAVIAQKAARPTRAASPRTHDLPTVRAAVAEEIARLCPWAEAEHIREADRLADVYGIDELDRVHLALALEDRLAIADVEFVAWRTVGDVVAAIVRAPVVIRRQ